MANVYKAFDFKSREARAFDRRGLEEFPEIPEEMDPEGVLEAEPEEEVDLEALRAAVLEEARAEAQRKVQEAYEEGLARGQKAGEEAFFESVAQAADALNSAAEAITQARQEFLDSLEPQLVALSALIAERALGREIQADPELVRTTARRALEKLADCQRLTARVNPADLEALRAHQVTLLEEFPALDELSVEADETVSPGGCVVHSATSCVDGRLDRLLEDVLDALFQRGALDSAAE